MLRRARKLDTQTYDSPIRRRDDLNWRKQR
jgi:hypothetical protein